MVGVFEAPRSEALPPLEDGLFCDDQLLIFKPWPVKNANKDYPDLERAEHCDC